MRESRNIADMDIGTCKPVGREIEKDSRILSCHEDRSFFVTEVGQRQCHYI